jgi:hypothetical protein
MTSHVEHTTAHNSADVANIDPEKQPHDETESKLETMPGSHKKIDSADVVDHAAERHLVRKLDLYIIPPTMMLYLFSFLDR